MHLGTAAVMILLLSSFNPTRSRDADNSQNLTVSLTPLGTGKGATAVYEGEPSSSFVIKINGECRLLVDTGLGVSASALRTCGSVPKNIFISHNHSDHAGELPVLLIVEKTAKRKLRVISGPEVNNRLVTHRIAELYSTGLTADEIADWIVALEGKADQGRRRPFSRRLQRKALRSELWVCLIF